MTTADDLVRTFLDVKAELDALREADRSQSKSALPFDVAITAGPPHAEPSRWTAVTDIRAGNGEYVILSARDGARIVAHASGIMIRLSVSRPASHGTQS